MHHIQTVSRAIEVCQEYHMPLVLTFVDYEKAFDNIETTPHYQHWWTKEWTDHA